MGNCDWSAVLIDLLKDRIGQAVLRVKSLQIAPDVGIVVGIDDGDGLARAVALMLLKPYAWRISAGVYGADNVEPSPVPADWP